MGGVPPRPTSSAEIQKSRGIWSVFVSESRGITVPLSFRSRKNRFSPLSRSRLQFTPEGPLPGAVAHTRQSREILGLGQQWLVTLLEIPIHGTPAVFCVPGRVPIPPRTGTVRPRSPGPGDYAELGPVGSGDCREKCPRLVTRALSAMGGTFWVRTGVPFPFRGNPRASLCVAGGRFLGGPKSTLGQVELRRRSCAAQGRGARESGWSRYRARCRRRCSTYPASG